MVFSQKATCYSTCCEKIKSSCPLRKALFCYEILISLWLEASSKLEWFQRVSLVFPCLITGDCSWTPLLFVHYCLQKQRLQNLHYCIFSAFWMLFIILRFSFLRYNNVLFYIEYHYIQEFHLCSYCILIFGGIWVQNCPLILFWRWMAVHFLLQNWFTNSSEVSYILILWSFL